MFLPICEEKLRGHRQDGSPDKEREALEISETDRGNDESQNKRRNKDDSTFACVLNTSANSLFVPQQTATSVAVEKMIASGLTAGYLKAQKIIAIASNAIR